MKDKAEVKDSWIQEIINETEHYFQGEMQQDQRASWLLATTSALIALLIGLQISAIERNVKLPVLLLMMAAVSYLISSIISIFTILPLRGVHSFWRDLFGKSFRDNAKMSVNDLIRKRFRHDDKWSNESFETRVMYHFRSHYLRNNRKAYGIIWSSIFLLLGLIFSAILVVFTAL